MNLVVSSRVALERQYGADGFETLRAALDDYAASPGAPSVVACLDDEDSMAAFGVSAMPAASAAGVLAGIRNARRMLPSVDSLLIIGNDHIVPYWQFSNPVTDRGVDPDDLVYTDNPYGASVDTFEAYLSPDLPVGRLADPADGSGDDLVAAIRALVENRGARRAREGSAAIVNADWFEITRGVMTRLAAPVDAWRTPAFQVGPANRRDLNRRFLYFNLHGFADDPAWKGFDDVRGRFFTVATPESFDREYISGSVVFAENCYGALTAGKTTGTSCALRLLQEGVAAVVGATGLAFGSHVSPNFLLENADSLASTFFAHACVGASTIGSALTRARRAYRDDAATPSSNVFKQKTLLQFTLLGDPSLI